jgi:hypothetical protein
VTLAQDFELSAIQLNNNKVEAIANVRQPESNLSIKLSVMFDISDRAFSN